jgi:hypothetical protein
MPRTRWTLEQDERLSALIAVGKSWPCVRAALRRDTSLVKLHAGTLRRGQEERTVSRRARAEGEEEKLSEPNTLDPTPELRDDTPISEVEFPVRIRTVLLAAGLKTVGEVRETSDEILLSFQDLGKASVAHFREAWAGRRPTGSGRWAKSPADCRFDNSPP